MNALILSDTLRTETLSSADALKLCEATAARNFKSKLQARACQHYSIGCPDCPFVYTTADQRELDAVIAKKRTQ